MGPITESSINHSSHSDHDDQIFHSTRNMRFLSAFLLVALVAGAQAWSISSLWSGGEESLAREERDVAKDSAESLEESIEDDEDEDDEDLEDDDDEDEDDLEDDDEDEDDEELEDDEDDDEDELDDE